MYLLLNATLKILFISILCLSANAANSAEFGSGLGENNRLWFALKGEIVEGDASKFERLIKSNLWKSYYVAGMTLDSPGGNLLEAIKLGQIVEKMGLKVYVMEGDVCASACFFLYVSAPSRFSKGSLIVHRPYFGMLDANGVQRSGYEAAYRDVSSQARNYLSSRSVPSDIIETLMQKASNEGYTLSVKDMLRVRIYSPAVDEYFIQHCGGVIEDRVMTSEEIIKISACVDAYISLERLKYLFGKDAPIAKEAFSKLEKLFDSFADSLAAKDPEFRRTQSLRYAQRLSEIINTLPPSTWVSHAAEVYKSLEQ